MVVVVNEQHAVRLRYMINSIDGISSTNTSIVCSGQGTCSLFDNCTCNVGYTGQWCDVSTNSQISAEEISQKQMQIGVTVGSVLSVVFGIILIIVIVPICTCFIRRRRKDSAKRIEMQRLLNEHLIDDVEMQDANNAWIIHHDDIVFEERVSEGTFGIVFKGLYKKTIHVAIKKLKLDDSREEFEREVMILKSLRHPVRLFVN